jgi:hypothetical protein
MMRSTLKPEVKHGGGKNEEREGDIDGRCQGTYLGIPDGPAMGGQLGQL